MRQRVILAILGGVVDAALDTRFEVSDHLR